MSEYLERASRIEQDSEQRAAFHAESSQVVIAGPGSGKTFLLTTTAARILLEGKVRYPQKIACITFSRQLADKLVQELRKLGVYDTERMYVGTIHAFCIAEILAPAVNLLPPGTIPEPFRIASEDEIKDALCKALSQQRNSFPENKWKNILGNLDRFRRRHFDPETNAFSDTSFPESRFQNLNWAQLAENYRQHLLQTQASVDFVQVEMLALRVLKTQPGLTATLSAAYPWWFVDEYQDLSPLFHQMVMHLVSQKRISVFAIGDPNQCIYEELQGSRPENVYELASKVGNAPITLKKNYRSPQNIIEISDRVLEKANGYQSSLEQAADYESIPVDADHHAVFEKVKSLIKADTTGVLTLSRKEKYPFRAILDGLENAGDAKYDVQVDKDPDFSSDTELLEWLQKLACWCSGGEIYFYELLPFWSGFCQPQGEDNEAKRLAMERELFHALWQLRNPEMTLPAWLTAIQQTVLIEARLNEYKKFRPDDVREFRKLVESASNEPRLKIKTIRSFGKTSAKIFLTTFHSSKGLEFDTAIVINLDGIYKSQAVPDLHRRVAYVAVSRAKSRLYVLVLPPKGEFAQKLSEISGEQLTFWDCDRTGKLTRRNE